MSWSPLRLLRPNFFQLSFLRNKGEVVRKSPNDIVKYKWTKDFRVADTRCHFPRAHEGMRIRKHGWNARMSTEGGRKVLMARILKGRHVLSH